MAGEKTLERTSKAAGASYRPLSVVSGTVTGMKTTTQEPFDLIVDSRLLSHEYHLADTIECVCGYRRPADYRPEPRGVLS